MENYIEINRNAWNKKTEVHITSEFYDVAGFLKGNNTLKKIELELLGNVKEKSILHLQCHFGQDTISLSRMGANVTGVDLSDQAIAKAIEFAKQCNTNTEFICCNIYDLPQHLNKTFDMVFTSYGTIGWLPDLEKWAQIINTFLKPGGQFVFAEFHPVVWMFDDDFEKVAYNYFNTGPIVEIQTGTYANREANIEQQYVGWNHSLEEVINNLLKQGLQLNSFKEYNYSPYNCFKHTQEFEPGKFRIKHLNNAIPMVYSLSAVKSK